MVCQINLDNIVKSQRVDPPAKAGVQKHLERLDSRLRGNDVKGHRDTFYESINPKEREEQLTRMELTGVIGRHRRDCQANSKQMGRAPFQGRNRTSYFFTKPTGL